MDNFFAVYDCLLDGMTEDQTAGIDLHSKRIAVIGHMNMPASVYEQAEQVLILERNPLPGDYPDSACDALLEFGIDRIAGLTITNFAGMENKIRRDFAGSPYPMGKPFLLRRESL